VNRQGATLGHLPTNKGVSTWALPKNDLRPWQFGTNGGRDPANQGQGAPATAQQRKCMEAIERDAPAKELKRYPVGMVRRLQKLQAAAEDPESKCFLQAQILIRTILIAPKSRMAEGEAAKAPEVIEVRTGRLEVPMPGAPGDVPPVAEAPAAQAG
jgi:hypothetical protein